MSDLCRLIWSAVFALFRSRAALHAEILFLRHQLNVLHRRSPKRVALSNIDRLVFAGLYCLAPKVLDALKILKPETVIRWHRAGFRSYGPHTNHGADDLRHDVRSHFGPRQLAAQRKGYADCRIEMRARERTERQDEDGENRPGR